MGFFVFNGHVGGPFQETHHLLKLVIIAFYFQVKTTSLELFSPVSFFHLPLDQRELLWAPCGQSATCLSQNYTLAAEGGAREGETCRGAQAALRLGGEEPSPLGFTVLAGTAGAQRRELLAFFGMPSPQVLQFVQWRFTHLPVPFLLSFFFVFLNGFFLEYLPWFPPFHPPDTNILVPAKLAGFNESVLFSLKT